MFDRLERPYRLVELRALAGIVDRRVENLSCDSGHLRRGDHAAHIEQTLHRLRRWLAADDVVAHIATSWKVTSWNRHVGSSVVCGRKLTPARRGSTSARPSGPFSPNRMP